MLKVVDAHYMDAIALAPRLREIDNLEVKCIGHTPESALLQGFELPEAKVLTALDGDEEAVLMCGVCRSDEDPEAGVIWMLASDDIDKHKKDFLRLSEPVADELSEGYKYVYNLVHKDNTKSIRWLRWNGFTVDETKVYDQGGEDFYLLTRENKKCVAHQQ